VASRDRFLRLFDLTTGQEVSRFGGRALEPAVVESEGDRLDPERVQLEFVGVAFLPGGDEVLGVANRHSLSRWRRKDGALLGKIEATAPGEGEAARLPVAQRRVGMSFFAASPDGVRVLTYSQDLRIHNLSSGEVERTLDFPAGVPTAAAFTPDGRSVVVGGSRGLCFRYEVESGEIVGRDKEVRGAVVSLALRPGAGEVLAGDLRFLRRWGSGDGLPVGSAMDHGAPVDVLAVSPDGARAFTGGGPPGGKVWTLGSDRLEVELSLGEDEPAGAFFRSPTDLVVVCRSGLARVFELPAAEPEMEIGTGDGAAAVAYSPETQVLAVVGTDGLRFFDMDGLRVLATYPLDGQVKGMFFAPDGRTVAVGLKQRDQVLRYDIGGGAMSPLVVRADGEVIPTRHQDDTRAGSWEVAFTPDGDRLVARSAGRALQVWSHPEGRRVGHVHGSVLNEVTGMCLLDAGTRVVSGAGKVAYRWKLEAAR
jgi:WD40 repeat protein